MKIIVNHIQSFSRKDKNVGGHIEYTKQIFPIQVST